MKTENQKPAIPLDYYLDSIKKLKTMGVKFITYNDLPFEDDFEVKDAYPFEFNRWNTRIKKTNDQNIYVLIQHDTDSGFRSTINLSRNERDLGAIANIMTFAKWRSDSEDGPLEEYPISFEALADLQQSNFMIGYHTNAWHNANFNDEKVFYHFYDDISYLISKGLNISFFSPHGGKTIEGKGNVSFDYMLDIKKEGFKKFIQDRSLHSYFRNLRWIHNRYTCKFNGYYSDGGLKRRMKDNKDDLDLNEFINNMKPGKRYRMLIHPQYYGNENLQRFETELGWYNNLF